jgi:hypothetical protein
MNTIEKLDQLAEFQAQRDLLDLQKKDLIAAAFPAEVKQRLDEIEIEFAGKAEAVDANIVTLMDEIKAEVIAAGATVKGGVYMAVWNKGRTTWDSKKLDGMASLIPQLNDARKVGEPTVTFRKAA